MKTRTTRSLSILTAALAAVLFVGDDAAAQRGQRGETDQPTRGTREGTQDAGGATRGGEQTTRDGQRGGEVDQQVDPRRGGGDVDPRRGGDEAERKTDDGAKRDGGQPELDRGQMQKAAAMMAQEEKNHRHHMAKIAALRKHFASKGMTDKVRTVDELERKEMARHEAKMERARQFLGDERYKKMRDYVGGVNKDRKAAIKEKMRENPERAKEMLEKKRKEQAGQDTEPQRGGGDADRDGNRGGGDADRGRGGNGNRGGGQDNDRDGNRGGNDRGGRGGRGGGR